jgi:hypothetical protein
LYTRETVHKLYPFAMHVEFRLPLAMEHLQQFAFNTLIQTQKNINMHILSWTEHIVIKITLIIHLSKRLTAAKSQLLASTEGRNVY